MRRAAVAGRDPGPLLSSADHDLLPGRRHDGARGHRRVLLLARALHPVADLPVPGAADLDLRHADGAAESGVAARLVRRLRPVAPVRAAHVHRAAPAVGRRRRRGAGHGPGHPGHAARHRGHRARRSGGLLGGQEPPGARRLEGVRGARRELDRRHRQHGRGGRRPGAHRGLAHARAGDPRRHGDLRRLAAAAAGLEELRRPVQPLDRGLRRAARADGGGGGAGRGGHRAAAAGDGPFPVPGAGGDRRDLGGQGAGPVGPRGPAPAPAGQPARGLLRGHLGGPAGDHHGDFAVVHAAQEGAVVPPPGDGPGLRLRRPHGGDRVALGSRPGARGSCSGRRSGSSSTAPSACSGRGCSRSTSTARRSPRRPTSAAPRRRRWWRRTTGRAWCRCRS